MSAPRLDRDGHFPGCASAGCEATRCAEARALRRIGLQEAAMRSDADANCPLCGSYVASAAPRLRAILDGARGGGG